MRPQREWCALCGEPSISSLQGGVFKLAVVDVSDGSDGEQARRQLIPLDQGAPGVQSGEEELHQRCFLTAENVTLFTSSTLNLDHALSVTLFCLFFHSVWGVGYQFQVAVGFGGQQKSHWSIFLFLTTRLCLFPMDVR